MPRIFPYQSRVEPLKPWVPAVTPLSPKKSWIRQAIVAYQSVADLETGGTLTASGQWIANNIDLIIFNQESQSALFPIFAAATNAPRLLYDNVYESVNGDPDGKDTAMAAWCVAQSGSNYFGYGSAAALQESFYLHFASNTTVTFNGGVNNYVIP